LRVWRVASPVHLAGHGRVAGVAVVAGGRLRPALDLAPVSASRRRLLLDELLETLEVAFEPVGGETELVTDRFDQALGLVVDLYVDSSLSWAHRLEMNHAVVLLAAGVSPGDHLVGLLFGDLGIPLNFLAADLGPPVQVGVVQLPDLLHAFHELREGFELGPLVVGLSKRDVDLDALLDGRHQYLLGRSCFLPLSFLQDVTVEIRYQGYQI